MDNPHPMMLLAALRGCIVLRHNAGWHRLTRHHAHDARAIFGEIASGYGAVASYTRELLRDHLASPESYHLAELRDFERWDLITEADLDWLDGG